LFGSGIGDPLSNLIATDKANAQAQASADRQMQFQERLSGSAYQRAMDDMRKAGINPMLAISQGGASTPSGASASVFKPDFKTPDNLNTALNTRVNEATLQKIRSDTETNDFYNKVQMATAENIRQQAKINSANAVKASQEAAFYNDHPWAIPLQQGLNIGGSAAGMAAGVGSLIKAVKGMKGEGAKMFLKRVP